jgi:hypothetical protein
LFPRRREKEIVGVFEKLVQRRIFGFEVSTYDSVECKEQVQERDRDKMQAFVITKFNPLRPELNPICYLLALLDHDFLHVSRIRVKSLTLRLLMLYIYIYIYGTPILDVSRSHTTTQHSR